MEKQKPNKKATTSKKPKPTIEKEPGLISNLDRSKVTNPFPPMKLGTGRHLGYISDTLFDDDLYDQKSPPSSFSLSQEFKSQSLHYLHLNTPRIAQCLDLLTEAEVWQRPNASSNSVGNLILHLCGNIRQYIVSGLGQQPDDRERDAEFAATQGFTKKELLQKLEATVREAAAVIKNADEANLLAERIVQGYTLTGVGIVVHVVEHYSYHAGQIAFWTKLLKDQDLKFYGDRNLNAKNEI